MHSMWFVLFPGGSDGKESVCNKGNPSLILGFGTIPWRREWLLAPIFLLENPMDRGAPRATVCGVTQIWTRLSD